MGQLESTMETISGASDSVNSSLSERRAQLEGLNGVKSNLAKLQLLMDLPPRLQACVEAKQYEEAVRHEDGALAQELEYRMTILDRQKKRATLFLNEVNEVLFQGGAHDALKREPSSLAL